MNENDLKELVKNGLQAQKAATQLGDDAAAEVAADATDPELKSLLSQGSESAKTWERRLTEALQKMGVDDSPRENEIIQAHYSVSKKIRAEAKSPEARDLGIIASGQLVMHYYIAGFGTLASYADRLGENETKSLVGSLLDEAKQADEAMTALAKKLLSR